MAILATADKIQQIEDENRAKRLAQRKAQKDLGALPKGLGLYRNNGTIWWKWYDESKEEHRESMRTKDPAEAVARREDRLAYIRSTIAPVPVRTRTTVGEVLENYIKYMYRRNKRSRYEVETVTRANLLPFFSDIKAVNLTEKVLDDYVQLRLSQKTKNRKTDGSHPNISRQTVNRELFTLRAACKRAVVEKLITAYPSFSEAIDQDAEKDGHGIGQIIPFDLIKSMIDCADPLHACFFSFLYFTGMRQNECSLLKHSDITDKIIILNRKTTKAGKSRPVPVTLLMEIALENLVAWKKEKGIDSDYIFVRENGELMTPGSIRAAWDKAGIEAGIFETNELGDVKNRPFRLHDTRHSDISKLSELGVSDVAIKRSTGHESDALSARYRHDLAFVDDIRSRLDSHYFDALPPEHKERFIQTRMESSAVPSSIPESIVKILLEVDQEKLKNLDPKKFRSILDALL